MNEPETIAEILRMKVIAVVGISEKEERPSFRVADYLSNNGYEIIPVNPNIAEWHGKKCYPDLEAMPVGVDVVDIFRKSEDVPRVVASAIAIGAKAVWMQEGVVNSSAAADAEEAGLLVVMDRCLMKEHARAQGADGL